MEKARILFITQEITPYLPESEVSVISRNLPQAIQERGKEIRTFMPRYGLVNERRNQLHEVIRLSGMNLIINNNDHSLIIKVSSIQAARMQVYFIDNEDFFQRKHTVLDETGNPFSDNDERAMFFAKGVLETVNKLRWSPDIIHCHGWFTSLVPLYIKTIYKDNPLFTNTRVVYSVYNDDFKKPLNKQFRNKLMNDGIKGEDVEFLLAPTYANLNKMAIEMSDGVIFASKEIHPDIKNYLSFTNKPIIEHNPKNYIDEYSKFYDTILSETLVEMV